MDTVIMKRLIPLILFVAACSRPPEPIDRSEELPPGEELAGTYALWPVYSEETVYISPEGQVVYRQANRPPQSGLAYKNSLRLIIFLDDSPEPTGIFMLKERRDDWPGLWNDEVRFARLLTK